MDVLVQKVMDATIPTEYENACWSEIGWVVFSCMLEIGEDVGVAGADP